MPDVVAVKNGGSGKERPAPAAMARRRGPVQSGLSRRVGPCVRCKKSGARPATALRVAVTGTDRARRTANRAPLLRLAVPAPSMAP